MATQTIPPAPVNTPMWTQSGAMTTPWLAWFREATAFISSGGSGGGGGSGITFPISIAEGGTNESTQQAAINALTGTQSAGTFLRSDGSNSTLHAIEATDVPTLNQNTTGSSGSCTGNAATATSSAACTGNSATATTAAACSGNSATATTASACSGNAATATTAGSATTAASITGNLTGDVTSSGMATTLAATTNSTLTTLSGLTSVGTIGTGTWQGTKVATGYGGTGVASVTTSPTASAFAGWDANKNITANNLIDGFATAAASSSTITLTVSSAGTQNITGSTTQYLVLPVASTMANGQAFTIQNQSTGSITVATSGSNTLVIITTTQTATITCVNNAGGTGTASWNYCIQEQSSSGLTVPSVYYQNSTQASGSTGGLFFYITTSATCAAGDTYTFGGHTYTIQASRTSSSAPLLTNNPSATSGSGTLTRATGSGSSTIAFTSVTLGWGYSPPAGALYLRVRMVGGGSGGCASGTGSWGTPGSGFPTVFGDGYLLTASGGAASATSPAPGGLGVANTQTIGSGLSLPGANGTAGGGGAATASIVYCGGKGADSAVGGGGAGGWNNIAGGAAVANSGSGGGGAGAANTASVYPGSGGSSGGFIDVLITSIASSYSYICGTGGAGGTAGTGTNAAAGGAGAGGFLEVTAYYQ